jgi:catechol 2,3-dioxygenase-like lactoylglutathione lyase family enzyme
MIGTLQCVVLDCPDPLGLARFYQAMLGGEVNQADARWGTDDDFSTLHTGSGLVFAFQRVPDFQAPHWPDSAHPQQFHLDLEVPDLDEARPRVLELGATLLRADPRGWSVYADPAGHPFCLLQERPGRLHSANHAPVLNELRQVTCGRLVHKRWITPVTCG